MLVLSIISLVFSVVVLIYAVHVAVVFQRFNDGIREWSLSLDDATRSSIYRVSREILSELDTRISLQNSKQEDDNLNISEDERERDEFSGE